jgi:CHAT domain-containing protein
LKINRLHVKLLIRRGIFLLLGVIVAIALSGGMNLNVETASPRSNSSPELATSAGARVVEIEQTWRGQYEEYWGTRFAIPSLTAAEINQTLSRLASQTRKKLALIYVFPQPEELELVLVIPGITVIRQTIPEAPRETFLTIAREFQTQISRPATTRAYLAPARQLYDWIIAPLELYLQARTIDTLVFCVGTGVRSLPLAALHDGQQFLIEKYNLGLIPAFTLTDSGYKRVQNTQILAMGASQFQDLAALPAVPLELSAITQNLRQGEVFLNQEFTVDNLRRQLNSRSFGIVHLATHAEFKPGTPDNSYIQLWQDEQLNLDQLRQLDWRTLPVELLVLSACQTALGDQEVELGFAGLSFQAGVKSSLASLWRTDDVGTLGLMQEFYWQLANPQVTTKAEALRRAQMALLHKHVHVENGQLYSSNGTIPLSEDLGRSGTFEFSSPYYWAAFTLVGSPW